MKKVYAFIDGFNLYHSITCNRHKWLNFKKLISLFTQRNEQVEKVLFFTSLVYWNNQKKRRHKLLIEALKSEGVKTIYGKFRERDFRCPRGHRFKRPTEKQTDVNIVAQLFKFAIEEKYDKAYIVSGDTDLVPAILVLKEVFPQKEFHVILPPRRNLTNEIKQACDGYHRIRIRHLDACIFPDPLVLPNGTSLPCPPSWK